MQLLGASTVGPAWRQSDIETSAAKGVTWLQEGYELEGRRCTGTVLTIIEAHSYHIDCQLTMVSPVNAL